MNLENITTIAQEYGMRLAVAVLILIIGFAIAGIIANAVKKALEKNAKSPELSKFLGGVISALLKAAVVLAAVERMGVEMTSFIAILGAMGLAIGMALSGTLQNFAGGVMILLFKPFKIGDFVEMQGFSGTVREIQIFNTILMTGDNRKVIIPNSPIASGAMVNYSSEETRRVDFVFGIGYGDDIDAAKSTLMELVNADSRILKDPEPFLAVAELADSSVNFKLRVWANAGDYWAIYFDMQENVKKTFDKKGISIPYPQMDVHVAK